MKTTISIPVELAKDLLDFLGEALPMRENWLEDHGAWEDGADPLFVEWAEDLKTAEAASEQLAELLKSAGGGK